MASTGRKPRYERGARIILIIHAKTNIYVQLLAVLLVQACWRYHSHRKNPGRDLTKFKKLYFRHYRNWKTNLRIILQNENKIDEVAILTTELGSLRRDFKEMLYHVTVDLEERLDRRMLRLGKTLNAQRAEERDQFRSLGHPNLRHTKSEPVKHEVVPLGAVGGDFKISVRPQEAIAESLSGTKLSNLESYVA